MACSGFAGGTLGYIMYDITHYVLHHTKLPKYFQTVKRLHLEHHYKNYELGFGVTSPSGMLYSALSLPILLKREDRKLEYFQG